MEQFYFRKLMVQDYNSGFFEVLNQLSPVTKPNYSTWITFINNLNMSQQQIIVVVDKETEKIVASGTLLIQQKIIHNMGKVAHIEDVVVDVSVRGKGLGKELIRYLQDIAIGQSVYKTTLYCFEKNTGFYEKCGFEKKGPYMAQNYM
jgi:glucosamine-phosphate N-acetyltransferase